MRRFKDVIFKGVNGPHRQMPDSELRVDATQYAVHNLCRAVEAEGPKRGIKTPARINYTGNPNMVFVSYTSNAVRDLIAELGAEAGLVRMYRHDPLPGTSNYQFLETPPEG